MVVWMSREITGQSHITNRYALESEIGICQVIFSSLMLRASLKRLRLFGKRLASCLSLSELLMSMFSHLLPSLDLNQWPTFVRWWSPLCLRQIQQGSQLPPCPPTPHGERWRRLAPEHSWEAPPCQPSPSCSSTSLSLSLCLPMYT